MIEAFALLVGAAIPSDIADMRAEAAKGALQRCLIEYATETYAAGANAPDAVQSAKTTCFVMYQDYKRTLQPIAERALVNEGAANFGREVVESVVEQVFAETTSSLEGTIAEGLERLGSATD